MEGGGEPQGLERMGRLQHLATVVDERTYLPSSGNDRRHRASESARGRRCTGMGRGGAVRPPLQSPLRPGEHLGRRRWGMRQPKTAGAIPDFKQ